MTCTISVNKSSLAYLLEGRKKLQDTLSMNPASEVVKDSIKDYNKLIEDKLNG